MHRCPALVSVVLLSLGIAACNGVIGDPAAEEPSRREVMPRSAVEPPQCDGAPELGVSPLSRLTRAEYDLTVAELLGTSLTPARAFAVDEELRYFVRNSGIAITAAQLDQYRTAAEDLASDATARLDEVLDCDVASLGDDECVRRFIDRFGRRAFRRPLTDRESAALYALASDFAGDAPTPANRVEGIVQAVLQSPQFLYRTEIGINEGAELELTGYELATRLSFLLWSSTPSEELLDAAGAGELDSAEGLSRWAERLMTDPRFENGLRSFVEQWLHLSDLATMSAKDAELFPSFDDSLRESMRAETVTFFSTVIRDGGTLSTLLTAPYSYADPAVAAIYGADHPGEGVTRIELDPERRAGLLTHASLMSLGAHPDQNSPVRRGELIRERFLCDPPPPPPPDVNDAPPPPVPGQTTRERFAIHTESATCAGCHALMDPIGWGFEHFDAIGAYRTEDLGAPVDASGELTQTRDIDGEFEGAAELGARLASSEQVEDCVVDLWFEYGVGRVDRDGCEADTARERFRESGGTMQELILGIVQTDAFRRRRVAQ